MKLFVVYRANDGLGHGFVGRSTHAVLKPYMQEVLESYEGDLGEMTPKEREMLNAIRAGRLEQAFRLHDELEREHPAGGSTQKIVELEVDEATSQAEHVFLAVHHDEEDLFIFVNADEERAARALTRYLFENGSRCRDVKKDIEWYFLNTLKPPKMDDDNDFSRGFYANLIGWLNESSITGLFEVDIEPVYK